LEKKEFHYDNVLQSEKIKTGENVKKIEKKTRWPRDWNRSSSRRKDPKYLHSKKITQHMTKEYGSKGWVNL